MEEKISIHYLVAHEKIRDLVFEEWEKMNLLINQGPDVMKEYFCKLWKETKQELEYDDGIDVIDLDKNVKPEDFSVSYSILENDIKIFNFIMPKPLIQNGQAECLSLVITKAIPRLFTLELANTKNKQHSFCICEWLIDFQNNEYVHKNYGKLETNDIGKFLGKVSEILVS